MTGPQGRDSVLGGNANAYHGTRTVLTSKYESHGCDDCARVRPTPDQTSAISWSAARVRARQGARAAGGAGGAGSRSSRGRLLWT